MENIIDASDRKEPQSRTDQIIHDSKRRLSDAWAWVHRQSTFFRLHLTAFVIIPLILSSVFYACNGRFQISFIDSLFLCYSAMTGTGLATVNLSTLTAFQQAVLWVLMGLGTTTSTSWTMALVRRNFIRQKCTYVYWSRKNRRPIRTTDISEPQNTGSSAQGPAVAPRIRINAFTPDTTPNTSRKHTQHFEEFISQSKEDPEILGTGVFSTSPKAENMDLPSPSPTKMLGDTHSADFASDFLRRRVLTFEEGSVPLPRRTMTVISNASGPFPKTVPGVANKYQGLGGFPGPIELAQKATKYLAPEAYKSMSRSLTMQTSGTIELDNDTVIRTGRNSYFRTDTMSEDDIEKIGGTEYRAMNLLCWLVPAYFVGVQVFTFLIFAPWLSAIKTYDHVFEAQSRLVSKPWYSAFLVMSAYSGTGLDLCDTAMVPFQEAYPMIFAIIFVLIAGNHGQAILLRFIIWIGSRITKRESELGKTLKFLLDHPRRCYLLLFPSAQTWFLLIVLCCLSVIDWPAFAILDLGLPVLTQLPTGTKVIGGLFQGVAVRASGLTIVAVSELAPAVQFLYIVMMYIAVYPVGMCIRATNVYEEKSLGIFEPPPGELEEDLEQLAVRERVGRYLGWHVRQQMSIDIWWLVWGIFVVAICERGNIMNPDKPYISMFPVMFELVSAFAGIGLSLGFPSNNYSLVGTMTKLSKLVIIIIMIRGRHRGLPVAVDRAVLLPNELVTNRELEVDPNQQENEKEIVEVVA